MPLTPEQRTRYERNLLIPGIGEAGQERLAAARVAIVGLGGLGSPVGYYLAAAGVGTLGLFDSDVVELSNLQRQVLHSTPRLGRTKIDSAAETLTALNPDVTVHTSQVRISRENADDILSPYDAVVEATDNFESKYVINDACVQLRKPFATAGILAMSGQALFVVPGQTPCLRCAVPHAPQGVPTTGQLGVLGAVPGILGSVEAMEIIRWIVGQWTPQADGSGRLHRVDGDTMRLHTMRIPRRANCRCGNRGLTQAKRTQ
jgi:adenylyltransferase/sulfurtransferase